ncbi:DnaJ-domain-containing protein [Jackrogersella minutella]|nr:DnaJ-domain-containing protein [Jackrogersella minutella]
MSSLPLDPYKVLGVPKDAQLPEIRAARGKLALKCHPDKVQDAKLKEEKQREFQEVQEAYELLSNEVERTRYDNKVRLEELRRDRGMTSTSTSSPRSSKRHETKYYDVREAEPRPTTFTSSTSHNVYGHTPPSRSWDEEIYARRFDEKPRHARKTASYEYDREKARKDEDRRRRDEEKEWNREKEKAREREKEIKEMERQREREALLKERGREREREKEREKEKEASKKEKDRRKEDRKDDKKKADKDRRKESEDKHRRHKSPYVEYPSDDNEEVIYMTSSSSKADKKKSSSRKYEDVPAAAPPPPRESSRPPPTSERERKNSETLESAIRYLSRSGGKPPPFNRAQTYHPEFSGVRHITPIAVPTPPPAAAAAFAPPPMATNSRDAPLDEDMKRSSTRPRRMSHDTPRSSKEKSHKKSGSSIKDAIIVDASPSGGARIPPSLQKSHSIPIPVQPETHRVPPLSRSSTDTYPRPAQAPGLERASTWMPDSDLGRERSGSHPSRFYTDDSSEEERDRRHRRGRRTQSPGDIPEEIPIQAKRYIVTSERRTVPVQDPYFTEESPRVAKKASYPAPNSSARRADPRAGYYPPEEYEEDAGYFKNVKYATTFNANSIKFSDVPHSLREEVLI